MKECIPMTSCTRPRRSVRDALICTINSYFEYTTPLSSQPTGSAPARPSLMLPPPDAPGRKYNGVTPGGRLASTFDTAPAEMMLVAAATPETKQRTVQRQMLLKRTGLEKNIQIYTQNMYTYQKRRGEQCRKRNREMWEMCTCRVRELVRDRSACLKETVQHAYKYININSLTRYRYGTILKISIQVTVGHALRDAHDESTVIIQNTSIYAIKQTQTTSVNHDHIQAYTVSPARKSFSRSRLGLQWRMMPMNGRRPKIVLVVSLRQEKCPFASRYGAVLFLTTYRLNQQ